MVRCLALFMTGDIREKPMAKIYELSKAKSSAKGTYKKNRSCARSGENDTLNDGGGGERNQSGFSGVSIWGDATWFGSTHRMLNPIKTQVN